MKIWQLVRFPVNQFRDVQVEDLLGRDPVELNMDSISEYITNKVVLVTGAGGSIGSEICRQISKFNPQKLVLVGHGENSIYTIEMELKDLYKNTEIEFITEIADLQDELKMACRNEYISSIMLSTMLPPISMYP